MDIPEGAKVPQDHLESVNHTPDEDELLAGLPELIPPTRLRPRMRNKIMTMATKLSEYSKEDGTLDMSPGDDGFAAVLEVLADIDEFAESIASDPAAYIEWSMRSSYEQLGALLSRYASAVGESSGSSR